MIPPDVSTDVRTGTISPPVIPPLAEIDDAVLAPAETRPQPRSARERTAVAAVLVAIGILVAVLVKYVVAPAVTTVSTPPSSWTGEGP